MYNIGFVSTNWHASVVNALIKEKVTKESVNIIFKYNRDGQAMSDFNLLVCARNEFRTINKFTNLVIHDDGITIIVTNIRLFNV